MGAQNAQYGSKRILESAQVCPKGGRVGQVGPKTGFKEPKRSQTWPQESPRGPPDGPKTSTWHPKGAEGGPKEWRWRLGSSKICKNVFLEIIEKPIVFIAKWTSGVVTIEPWEHNMLNMDP